MKHAKVLHAIVDGKEVEYKAEGLDFLPAYNIPHFNPLTHPNLEWRIKTEPKPDDEWLVVFNNSSDVTVSCIKINLEEWKHAIKLIFDAETNEFKKVEVVK